jgi:hypothetical protein
MSYQINDTPVLYYTYRRYYTGNNLDSTISRDGQGNLNSVTYYAGGNPTVSTFFSNNIPSSTSTTTYLDISSGGLFLELGTSKLRDTYTNVAIPATTNFYETNTYGFDSVNRVISVMRDHHGYGTNQKEIYTWY